MNRPLVVVVAVIGSILLSGTPAAANQPDFKKPAVAAAVQSKSFVPSHINRQPTTNVLTVPRSQAKVEQVRLRTSNSRTFVQGAAYETTIYQGPVNYKDTAGNWQAIDGSLVASSTPGYAFKNRANRYSLELPADIGTQPVRASLGPDWIQFRLLGAHGSGRVSGQTITYTNALPGVNVAYSAAPDGVKEALTISSPGSVASFVYDLQTSPGLLVRGDGAGGIEAVDSIGRSIFSMSKPFLSDGSRSPIVGGATLKLIGTGSQLRLQVTPDAAWLADPNRAWPVVLDPNVSFFGSTPTPSQDCYILGVNGRDYSGCGLDSLLTGWDGTNYLRRTLVQFDLNSVPSNSTVLSAQLAMRRNSTISSTPQSVDLYPLTHWWTGGTTWGTGLHEVNWNLYDGSNSWNTFGGDYQSPATWTTTVASQIGFYTWSLTNLVQSWVNGQTPNDGMLLKESDETVNNIAQFDSSFATDPSKWPYLSVRWYPQLGDQAWYELVRHRLTDRINLDVNVANGNLLVHQQDLMIRGTGLNLQLDRYYNELCPYRWDLGICWSMSTGADVMLNVSDGDGVTYYGPGQSAAHFIRNADGSFTSPAGIDAQLTYAGGVFSLKFNASSESYNFDGNGYLTSDVDRNGNRLTFSYNGTGALSSITDTQGRVTTLAYNSGVDTNLISGITDSASRQLGYTYNADKTLATYTDAIGGVTRYGYDTGQNLTKITDPVGNITLISYDTAHTIGSRYRVSSTTYVTNTSNMTGPTTSFAYYVGAGSCSAQGVVGYTAVQDANNHLTTYCYDAQAAVLQVIDPNGNSSKNSHTSDLHPATGTDALGQTSSASYNAANDLTAITPPVLGSGHTPASGTSSFQTPSSVMGYQYLASSTTDAQGNCTAYLYDSAGNVTDVYAGQSKPCDGQTGGTHGANRYQGDPGVSCSGKPGELCSTTDALGNTTSYGYDSNGNQVSVTPPGPLGGTTIVPDGLSRTSSVTDGKAQRTSYSYDQLDRITQVLYNGATTCTPSTGNCISYVYDSDGNQTSMTDNTGTTNFYYDSMNRLTTESLPNTSSNCTGSSPAGMTRSYDGVGNLTQSCDSGGIVTYAYDAGDRLTSIAEPGGNCGPSPSLCTTFAYNANDQRTQTTFPGAATLIVGYDSNSNITSVVGKDRNGTVLTSFSYTYNMGSTDTQLRQTVAENDPVATNSYLYSYDSLNRLARAGITSGTGTTYIYGYDATGNMTSKTVGGTPTSFRYNAANELCWAVSGLTSNTCAAAPVGATTYSYDANGNKIGSSIGDSFSYNPKNQTTAIMHGGVNLSPLTYSGTDQTQRVVAGSTTFSSGSSGVQVSTTGGTSTYYLRDNDGTLIGERNGSNHYYYLTDALGSITAVVSGDGLTIGDRYGYDPYGSFTYQSGTIANPCGYAGTYFDAATGLYKMGKRYYDPSLGRWTQEDAVRDTGTEPQAGNLYAYAKDDPINVVDPDGNWGIPIPRYHSTFRPPPRRHNPFRSWRTTAWFFSGLLATAVGVGFTVLLVGEIAATGGLSLFGPSILTGGAAATSYAWAGYSFKRALE